MGVSHMNKSNVATFSAPSLENMAYMFLQHQPLGTVVRIRHDNDSKDTCYHLVEKAGTVPQIEEIADPEPELKHRDILPNRLPSSECLISIEKASKNDDWRV